MEFSKKKVLVVGLGKSGVSTARWLSGEGADVIICDIKPDTDIDREFLEEAREMGVRLETGGHREETFIDSDVIIISPGVPLDLAPLTRARERGIPVLGEMELAAGLFDTPIVAITGTNGKSTAVSLLGDMIRGSGAKVFVGGNIGTPLMDYVAGDHDADYVLVEVSSFQLDTMERFRPYVSLLLNISPDHLDRYPDFEAYVRSKLKIFRNQGPGQYSILNDDDERLSRVRPEGGVSVLRYGWEEGEGRHAFIHERELITRMPGGGGRIFDLEEFGLPGRHNLENLMAVVLAGLTLRIDPGVIQDAIKNYKGLPHRMELVGSIGGIDFYDDSKATNVDAAVRSVSSFQRPLILIAGGRHKGGEYLPLVIAARDRVKTAVLLGEAKTLMAREFEGVIPLVFAEDMGDAVKKAFARAEAGDAVLLAPACSSFDMFRDYGHRGRVFREEVKGLNHGG